MLGYYSYFQGSKCASSRGRRGVIWPGLCSPGPLCTDMPVSRSCTTWKSPATASRGSPGTSSWEHGALVRGGHEAVRPLPMPASSQTWAETKRETTSSTDREVAGGLRHLLNERVAGSAVVLGGWRQALPGLLPSLLWRNHVLGPQASLSAQCPLLGKRGLPCAWEKWERFHS